MRVFEDVAASRLGKMLDSKHQTGKYSYPYLANFNVQWFRFNIENLNQMDFDEDDLSKQESGLLGIIHIYNNVLVSRYPSSVGHRISSTLSTMMI